MKRGLAVVLLVAATVLAFAPVTGTGFVDFDDDVYVSANPHIQRPLDASSLRWALTSFYAASWHPVTWLSHMIDWALYGGNPVGHHVTSVLLHLASVLVLFFALDFMTGATGRSAFAAALFAVHPLRVESVVWLAERKDVLCALFWFLAIAAYARWRVTPRVTLRLAVVLLAALALMSKAMAVTLPLTLLLIDFWPFARLEPRTVVGAVTEKAPLFVLSAATAWLAVLGQHSGGAVVTLMPLPLSQRIENSVVVSVGYLLKMAWPVRLAVFYPHPLGTLPAWKIAAAAGVLVLFSAAALHLRRDRPYLLFGWLWYLVTLLPVIGLVQVGEQGMADRFTYVPLVGIFVALTWGAGDIIASFASRWEPRAVSRFATGASIAMVVLLVARTRFEVHFWKDAETLFTRALAVTERNAVAQAKLGLSLSQQGKPEEAHAHFLEAVRIQPESALAHLDLGSNLLELKREDEALAEFRAALLLDPGDPKVHVNLGGLLEQRGEVDAARSHFEEAIRLEPGLVAARVGLAKLLSKNGRLADAVAQYRAVLSVDPANASVHEWLGSALAQLARYDEAYAEFAEAIRLDPRRATTHYNWGTVLANESRHREAAAHFAEAIRLSPTFAPAHFNLAVTAFFLGDYALAWREVRSSRSYGFEPPPGFVSMLARKMPEPR